MLGKLSMTAVMPLLLAGSLQAGSLGCGWAVKVSDPTAVMDIQVATNRQMEDDLIATIGWIPGGEQVSFSMYPEKNPWTKSAWWPNINGDGTRFTVNLVRIRNQESQKVRSLTLSYWPEYETATFSNALRGVDLVAGDYIGIEYNPAIQFKPCGKDGYVILQCGPVFTYAGTVLTPYATWYHNLK